MALTTETLQGLEMNTLKIENCEVTEDNVDLSEPKDTLDQGCTNDCDRVMRSQGRFCLLCNSRAAFGKPYVSTCPMSKDIGLDNPSM